MGDVHRSGEPFHGRPLQPMPGKVEDPDGNAHVDDLGARQGLWVQLVLPGAREQDQRLAGPKAGQHRSSQLVNVLADAGALPERRAVIEQDAHARGIVTCRQGHV